MAHFGKALDEICAQESRKPKPKGYEPALTMTRWLLLKHPGNLSDKGEVSLAGLVRYNLRSVRACLLKEEFQFFWTCPSPFWAW